MSPAAAFAALGDPQRLALLERLGEAPASATTLAAPLQVSRQAVVQQLKVLEAAGLVTAERVGREVRYRVRPDGLAVTADWLERHRRAWRRRLTDLKARAELD